jgi:hypothetical protein
VGEGGTEERERESSVCFVGPIFFINFISLSREERDGMGVRVRTKKGVDDDDDDSEVSPLIPQAQAQAQSQAQAQVHGERTAGGPKSYNGSYKSLATTTLANTQSPLASASSNNTRNISDPPHRSVDDSDFDQEIEIDDDLSLKITGFKLSASKLILYRLSCLFTGGLLFLLCRWFPHLELSFTCDRCKIDTATKVQIQNQWDGFTVEDVVQNEPLEGGSYSDVFTDEQSFASSSSSSSSNNNINAIGADSKLDTITYFDHRYMKFVLNPRTRLFILICYWKDTRHWVSLSKALEGVDGSALVSRRRFLFGENQILIREKSDAQLLVDEVLHPFFVFQIASMILWSLDEYYYYAACIFAISVSSVLSTLWETKSGMSKEINLFFAIVAYISFLCINTYSHETSERYEPVRLYSQSVERRNVVGYSLQRFSPRRRV